MFASALVGVWSGFLIGTPPWSVLAAIILAVATVGMVGGVLWLPRRGWEDTTWPPFHRDEDPRARLRKTTLWLTFVMLAPLPLGLALLVWTWDSGELSWTERIVFLAATCFYAAGGVGLLAFARSLAKPAPVNDERPAGEHAEDGGWVALRNRAPAGASTALAAPSAIFVVVVPVQFIFIVRDSPLLLALLVVVLALIFLGLAWWIRGMGDVRVRRGERRLRAGRREVEWGAITRAELFATPLVTGTARTLVVTLRDDDRFRARILLRRKGALTLTQRETDLLADVIEGTEIVMPHDKDDPRGRFSKVLYPANLTKAETAVLIADPPGADDPLPIPVQP